MTPKRVSSSRRRRTAYSPVAQPSASPATMVRWATRPEPCFSGVARAAAVLAGTPFCGDLQARLTVGRLAKQPRAATTSSLPVRTPLRAPEAVRPAHPLLPCQGQCGSMPKRQRASCARVLGARCRVSSSIPARATLSRSVSDGLMRTMLRGCSLRSRRASGSVLVSVAGRASSSDKAPGPLSLWRRLRIHSSAISLG